MKKRPSRSYEKRTGRRIITGVMASESYLRQQKWLQNGCNAFHLKHPTSTPIAFWTEQDVLRYIKDNGLPIAEVYGAHLDRDMRFVRLKRTHPRQYEYCMGGGEYDADGLWKPNKEGGFYTAEFYSNGGAEGYCYKNFNAYYNPNKYDMKRRKDTLLPKRKKGKSWSSAKIIRTMQGTPLCLPYFIRE